LPYIRPCPQIQTIQTLTDLNRFFSAWLEVAYHQKVHNSFKQRPIDRYHKDDHPIWMLPPHELAEVFLLEESRKVDKTGCMSLLGCTYEVETKFAGSQIQVRFDPHDLSMIQVWKDGVRFEDAKPLLLRDPRKKMKKVEVEIAEKPSPTGLNYVELLAEEQHRQIREAQAAELTLALKEVKRP
jgi:putative transposase